VVATTLAVVKMATTFLALNWPGSVAGASEHSVTIPLTTLFYDGSYGNPVISVSIGTRDR
jgi:hypothetical protein